MKVVEEIKMKCTREQYESIKHIVGELEEPGSEDFNAYNYLHNNKFTGGVLMFTNDGAGVIYETFDKDIFLKACGKYTPKIIEVELTRQEIETILGYKIKIVK
jgi:hypothetical protein